MTAGPAPLPATATPLLGRELQLAAVRELVVRPTVRLLTLTGAPGVGKTRLAIEAAAALRPRFGDGVYFVPLAAVGEAERAPAALAEALQVPWEGSRPPAGALREFFRSRTCLLLLDNLEHIPQVGLTVAELLAAAPGLTVLATSRVPLHLTGEHEFEVPPLPVPDDPRGDDALALAENPSVALYCDRARAVQPGYQLTSATAPVIAEICRRMEGIPLAIELAAARGKFLGAQGLLERLDDRLSTLRGGARDLPARQQTLEAAIAWSYDLLDPPERRLFARLSVLVGGWGLEAAADIAGDDLGTDPIQGLEHLVDHSLVQASATTDGVPRFGMLETLREYARARLREQGPDEQNGVARRHALHFRDLASGVAPALRGGDTGPALARLDLDRDNLRAAVQWSLDAADAELALALCAALSDYWRARGVLTEGRASIERALGLPGGAGADRARCLCAGGMLARLQGDLTSARTWLQQAAEFARETARPEIVAEALTELGIISLTAREFEAAEAQLSHASRLWREQQDTWGLLFALNARAGLASVRYQLDDARRLREEGAELARSTGHRDWEGRALIGLGEIARHQGEHATSERHLRRALELFRDMRNPVHTALVLRKLAHVWLHLGDLRAAQEALGEAVETYRRIDQPAGRAACAVGLAWLHGARGDDVGAVRLLGAADAVLEGHPGTLQPADAQDRDALLDRSRTRLGEQGYLAARAQGRLTPLDQLLTAATRDAARLPEGAAPSRRPGGGAATPQPLTTRESDVLRLLARGLSYAEIGKALFVSPRTVDAHLRAVYAKLGVRSRHEATRLAQEHGLV